LEPFVLMGVVNVTPDSFSDGGRFTTADAAAARGRALAAQGAAIIDVGGESTRPGASRVDAAEQVRRVVPAIAALREATAAAISIDTTLAEVAEAAIDAGATIVNDVSAGLEDPNLLRVVARRGVGIVLMHRVLPPERDRYSTEYAAPLIAGDPVRAVSDALLGRLAAALDAGVAAEAIALDPGFGFGKTADQNWTLLARLGELVDLGRPIVAGLSRKSFIGAAIGVEDPSRRVVGSAVAAALALAAGARILRVHDVAETAQAARVMLATQRAIGDPAGEGLR
jgi:dihydropteroate synthase